MIDEPRMYTVDELQREVQEVDRELDERVTAFLIGGGAMAFAGLKASTKDIDVVVKGNEPFHQLSQALEDAGYSATRDLPDEYAQLGAAAHYDRAKAPMWDVYVGQVCNCLLLSPDMIDRSLPVELELEKLDLHRVAPADVFIFKSITEREADRDDMEDIFAEGLDWDAVLEEMRWQTRNSDRAWSAAFHATLEAFADDGFAVPILDELEELVDRDVGEARVLQLVDEGTNERDAIIQAVGEDPPWVEEVIEELVRRGRLKEANGRLLLPS